ncbi:MAG: TIGR03016 family PEP-CTERM system-associated outer membrane protein [Pseudomonadota bacterium]|nr:TIGR03016 family PEP-CTERM system-associated outer membrane protein [Pseudomonadota bacterium]
MCAGLVLGYASSAGAQKWVVEPSIAVQATATNNANLDTGAQGEADLIINFQPALSFSREGPRLRINGAASLNFIGYANGTQTSRVLPQANILANLEAIERVFYIEAALQTNQEVLNPFLAQSDRDSTFNKYTYTQARIAPYLQGRFGNDWRYLVRSDNSYTYTSQSDTDLSNAYFGRHVAELVRLATPLGGSLRVQSDVTRFNDQAEADQHLEVALATINYAFTPQFSVGLRGGYERSNYTTGEESGPIYGAEFAWLPNARTRLAGFWESRFFGPSYQLGISNRQRRFATDLSASRSVTTYPQLILQLPATGNVSGLLNAILVARFPDPVERARQVQDLIGRQALPSSLPGAVNIFSRSVNVQTSGSATFALIGVRNTLALNLFYLKTDQLPDAAIPTTFITFNNNIQRGGSLSLNHRLTPVMTLNASVARRETRGFDLSSGNVTDQNSLEVQATRQLTPRSQAFIGARYQQQDSSSNFSRDSNEAAIFVGFARRL